MPQMPKRNYNALIISLGVYVLMSPLATYNSLAMFGLVESRYVPLQLTLTAIMIVFAIIGSQPLSKHCLANPIVRPLPRKLWIVGFYIIGPPVLYVYYRLYYKTAIA